MNNNQTKLSIRLKKLLAWKKVSEYRLANDISISRTLLNDILNSKCHKNGTIKGISDHKLRLIADYFFVDVNYLKDGRFLETHKQSARRLINTMNAFGLSDMMMSDEDISHHESLLLDIEENIHSYLLEEINALDKLEIYQLFTLIEAISHIDQEGFDLLINFNYLSQQSKDKVKELLQIFDYPKDVTNRIIQVCDVFKRCELMLNDRLTAAHDVLQETDDYLNVIHQVVQKMSYNSAFLLFDHLEELITLDHDDLSLLRHFYMLRNEHSTASTRQRFLSTYMDDMYQLERSDIKNE